MLDYTTTKKKMNDLKINAEMMKFERLHVPKKTHFGL
jgi:hypothetical protein